MVLLWCVLELIVVSARSLGVESVLQMFKGASAECVVLFHFHVAYGGGRSTGFGLIYDNLESLKKYEPRWRQIRYGYAVERSRKRKVYKELKKKIRTTWGTGRRARVRKERRAAE
jgi:small subunit ribosomal protein S24e